MGVFSHVSTKLGSGIVSLSGVADLEVAEVNGQWMLYSASLTDYSLGAFRIGANGALTQHDGLDYGGATGTLGVQGIEVFEGPSGTTLIPMSRYDDRLAIHEFDNDGGFDEVSPPAGSIATQMARISAATSIEIDGTNFAYFASSDSSGFKGYQMDNDYDLAEITPRNDNAKAHLGDVTDMVAATAYGKWFMFATSGIDAGVSSYRMDKNGQTYSKHNTGPEDGIGINAPSALTTVSAGSDVFLVVAGAGSNSLTVFRITKQGVMREKDHVIDDGETRFENVTALEAVEVNGRSFILAGGSDDGITLFELTPRGGKLKLWGVLEDSDGVSLSDISDIEALVIGDEMHIYVSSTHENGITHMTATLGDLAGPTVGTKNDEVFEGSEQDDLIMGMNGEDTLRGNGGDDWLVDGPGMDVLEGGAGADVFCFAIDRKSDTVLDFTPGVDRIDLSELSRLYSMDQLNFNERDFGVVINYGSEYIRVLSNDRGGEITVDDFQASDFLFS